MTRWGVFVRENADGDWHERHRWVNGDLDPLPDATAASARAEETRHQHPQWDVEVRQVSDPLPGSFRQTFAEYLP